VQILLGAKICLSVDVPEALEPARYHVQG